MAQHDYVISNDTGANVRTDINNVLQAILTSNAGSTQPSTTQPGMLWGDTGNASTFYLKIRNHTNDGWNNLYSYDVATKTIASTTALTLTGLTPTITELNYVDGVTSAIQTQLDAKVSKVTSTDNAVVRFDGTTGQVQNSGVTIDDSGNVGIGTSSPSENLTVYNATDACIEAKSNNKFIAMNATQNYRPEILWKAGNDLGFGTANDASGSGYDNRMIISSAGNVGIGVTPSAWGDGNTSIDIKGHGNIMSSTSIMALRANAYYNGTNNIYKSNGYASMIYQQDGTHTWYTAPSGTAGNPITWTNAMTLGSNGRISVPASNIGEGIILASFGREAYGPVYFEAVNSYGANGNRTAMFIGRNSTTNRSINAGGTVNASGADYAEYEYNNGLSIAKGQIVGFKADGTLTNKYSEAIRFAIKSTNPSYVGGDTWGNEDVVGRQPLIPTRKLDKTEQSLVSEAIAEVLDEDGNVVTEAQEAVYETIVIEAGDTDTEWEAIEAKYEDDKADFEARLEAERIKVDRVAYAGKCPVNVQGATAGQYIVAISKEDDDIDGIAVDEPSFTQYLKCVGRVNKILDDGRAEVAVIIH